VRVALCISVFVLYILLISIVLATVPFLCCSVKLPLCRPRNFCLFLSILLPTPVGGGATETLCGPFVAGQGQTATLFYNTANNYTQHKASPVLSTIMHGPQTTQWRFHSSSCALVFLTPSLQNQAASLYSTQDTCPCFYCLHIYFLPFILTGRFALSHAGLLPSYPDF